MVLTALRRSAIIALASTALSQDSAAQWFGIDGTVSATDGTPLSGVRVRIVESGRRTFTDSTGRFRLDSASTGIVEFSLAGRRSVQQCLEGRTTVDVTMELDERGWWRRLRAGSPVRVVTGGRMLEGQFTGLENERLLVTLSGSMDSIRIRDVQRLWHRGSAMGRGARIGGAAGALGLAVWMFATVREQCDEECGGVRNVLLSASAGVTGAAAGALVGAIVGRGFPSWVRLHP